MKNLNQNNDCNPDSIERGNLGTRPEYICNLLVSAIAQVSSDLKSHCEVEAVDEIDPLQEILDGAFGEFDHCEVNESFYDEGVRSFAANGWKAEKFESFNVVAEVWTKVQITLPFNPAGQLSLAQQRHIHRNVTELLSHNIDAKHEPEVSDAVVWLADTAGEPTVFISGLFDVLEGRLTERQLKRITKNAWAAIPSDLLGSDQTE